MYASKYFNSERTSFNASNPEQCYYILGCTRIPETAISVEKFPDIVLNPEFKQVLDKQFKVSG